MAGFATLGTMSLHGTDAFGVRWVVSRDQFSGWDGAASTVSVQQKPRSDGGWGGVATRQPKHPTLGGVVYAPNEAALWDARDRLNEACSLYPTTLTIVEPARSRFMYVQREDEVSFSNLSPTAAAWSIQLLALDPRKFGTALTGSTGLPSSSGGLTVPFTVPFTIASTVVSGQVSLTNPGNTNGPVSLRIDGPVTGPIVTHVGSGRSLVFSSSLVLGAGEFITVDMERHEVLAQGQSSRNGWVTGRGWSQFEPGSNTWSFSALAASPTASLTVTATPAWE